MDGMFGFAGWQWMFAVEGLLATVVGVWAYFYLVDRPAKANFLTEDEKQALLAELGVGKGDQAGGKCRGH